MHRAVSGGGAPLDALLQQLAHQRLGARRRRRGKGLVRDAHDAQLELLHAGAAEGRLACAGGWERGKVEAGEQGTLGVE